MLPRTATLALIAAMACAPAFADCPGFVSSPPCDKPVAMTWRSGALDPVKDLSSLPHVLAVKDIIPSPDPAAETTCAPPLLAL
jgi:hypothetical protein